MNSISQYYKILGLELTASTAEIKIAYRNLAKKWHPDRFISQPEQLKKAEQEIQKINQAYEIIKEYIQNAKNIDTKTQLKTQIYDADHHYNLGVKLAEQENYQEAIAEFSQAIKLNNEYIKAYQYRGFILSKLGYENRADADFGKVKKIKINNKQSKTNNSSQQTQNYNNSYNCTPSQSNDSVKDHSIHTIFAHKATVSSILISTEDQLLITIANNNFMKIWNLKTGQNLRSIKGDFRGINCLAISNDNQTIISGNDDNTIRFWDIKQQKIVKTLGGWFSGHSQAVISVLLDSKNKILLSAGADNQIKIWDLTKNKEIKNIDCKSGQVTSLAFNKKYGYFCNSGLEKQIRIRRIKTGEIIRSLRGNAGTTCLSFSNDGNFLATAEMNRQINIFNLKTGKIVKVLKKHQDRISSLVFSANDKQLISTSWDKTIKVWDIEKEMELETLTGHRDRIVSLALTSDGKTIISGSRDGTIKIWKFKNLNE